MCEPLFPDAPVRKGRGLAMAYGRVLSSSCMRTVRILCALQLIECERSQRTRRRCASWPGSRAARPRRRTNRGARRGLRGRPRMQSAGPAVAPPQAPPPSPSPPPPPRATTTTTTRCTPMTTASSAWTCCCRSWCVPGTVFTRERTADRGQCGSVCVKRSKGREQMKGRACEVCVCVCLCVCVNENQTREARPTPRCVCLGGGAGSRGRVCEEVRRRAPAPVRWGVLNARTRLGAKDVLG